MAGGTAVGATSRMKTTGLLLTMRTTNTEEKRFSNERANNLIIEAKPTE